MGAALVVAVRGAGDEPFADELGEEAAQLAPIEPEIVGQFGGRGELAMGQLVEHPDLRKSIWALEMAGAEEAEFAGVEAVEPADGLDVGGGGCGHAGLGLGTGPIYHGS